MRLKGIGLVVLLAALSGRAEAQSAGISFSPPAVGSVGGSGTASEALAAVAYRLPAAVATSGTAEEVVATITLPANTLNEIGSSIYFGGVAITAANTNNKRIRVRSASLVGTEMVGTIQTTTSAASLFVDLVCWRTATAGTLKCRDNITGAERGATGLTFTGPLVFVVTLVTATAAADATLDAFNVIVR